MYLDPIYRIMDNSSLRLLEEEWRERAIKKERKEGKTRTRVEIKRRM